MSAPYDEHIYGYWPSRQLNGLIPPPIKTPDQFDGSETLNLACTQTSLTPAQQKKLVRDWCELLPKLELRTLVFSTKVNQELFEAATQIKCLEALSIKWSSVGSIESITRCSSINALFLGSSPAVSTLDCLQKLRMLRNVFIERVGVKDLSFVVGMNQLRELGLSGGRGSAAPISNLFPLSGLLDLEMLWLVNVKIESGGLEPLFGLKHLASFRSTFRPASPEVQELVRAVPTIRHLRPVG